MKVKRIISALAALAMSVSCLAGLTITASAEITKVEIGDVDVSSFANSGRISVGNNEEKEGKTDVDWFEAGGKGHRTVYYDFSANPTSKAIKISTDIKLKDSNNGENTQFYVSDGTNKVLDVQVAPGYAKGADLTVNGVDIKDAITYASDATVNLTGWFKIDAVANFDEHTVEVTITDETKQTPKTFVTDIDASLDKVNKLGMEGNTFSTVYLHEFTVSDLTSIPSYKLDTEDTENIHTLASYDAQESINISEAQNLTSVKATSANPEAVTIVDGETNTTKVTVKGVKDAAASEITVVGKSADGAYTTKKFVVKTSNVNLRKVTVNYYKTGTTDSIKTADTYTDQAEGAQIAELIPEATLLKEDDQSEKYTLKEVKENVNGGGESVIETPSAEKPYTVKAGGDTVVNCYYDVHAKQDSVKVNHKAGSAAVGEGSTETLTNTYEGDEFTYYYPKYLTGADNKVTHKYTSDNGPFYQKTTLTNGIISDGVDVTYEAYEGSNPMWAVEAETAITASNALKGNTTGITDTTPISNGNGVRRLNSSYAAGETGVQLFTVPEDGKYKITLRAAFTNAKTGTFTLYNGAKNAEPSVTIGKTDTIDLNVKDFVVKSGEVEEFALKKGDVIYIEGDSDNAFLDLATFEKTADLEPESKPVAENPTVLGSITKPDGVTDELDTYAAEMKVKTISIVIPDSESEVPKLSVQNYNGGAEFDPGWVAVTSGGSRIFYVQFRAADFAALGTVKATYGGKDIAISLAD